MGNVNCLYQCTEHETKAHIAYLQHGAVFNKTKYLLGIPSGSEKIYLRLSEDEKSLQWKPHNKAVETTDIEIGRIATIKPKGDKEVIISSLKGDTLLEVEAEDAETRENWVLKLQLVIDDCEEPLTEETSDSTSSFRKLIAEKTEKQAYWAKRTQDLNDRKQEAEEKKKRFSGVGMKYTALAMSNRDTKN